MARPRKDAVPDISKPTALTVTAIAALACPTGKAQVVLRDSADPYLRVRAAASGSKHFIFERTIAGKLHRITIGNASTWTIEQARSESRRLAVLLDQGTDPREQARQRRASAAAKVEDAKHTLSALLDASCDHLEALGRRSHKDARSITRLHIKERWPKIAALPAKDVTPDQIADVMRTLIEKGKDRTSNKLRSYVHAAYQVAKAARSKPSIPIAFKAFGITHNPASDVEPDAAANRAACNPLTLDQLRTYWSILERQDGLRGAALRLHLLTGGQRVAQFVRLRVSDITDGKIVLFDQKGRPGHAARVHTLPLTAAAAKALAECRPTGDCALSTHGGRDHISADSLSRWASGFVGDTIPGFTLKRVRSGVETLLAANRVSQDIRGRLQSHGIHGVQARHYDGYDYLAEKTAALEKLHRMLTQTTSGNVRLLRPAGG